MVASGKGGMAKAVEVVGIRRGIAAIMRRTPAAGLGHEKVDIIDGASRCRFGGPIWPWVGGASLCQPSTCQTIMVEHDGIVS